MEKRIGDYILLEPIGATTLATVFRARSIKEGPHVALKLLRRYLASDEERLGTFFDQIQEVKNLNHSGILSPLELGHSDGNAWVVYPITEDPNLSTLMTEHNHLFDLSKTLVILDGIAIALDYAHQQGVTHQNLKPNNVFVSELDSVRLSDFAMPLLAAQAHPLVKGALKTPDPAYMAPEQADGKSVDSAADVYSLGVIAFRLLTGQLPFLGTSLASVSISRKTSDVPSAHEINPILPSGIDEIFYKVLDHLPSERFRSGEAFVESLKNLLEPELARLNSNLVDGNDTRRSRSEEVANGPQQLNGDDNFVICSACGHPNSLGRFMCLECWAILDLSKHGTMEEGEIAEARHRRKLRLNRGVAILTTVVLCGVITFVSLGVTLGLFSRIDKPISTVSVGQAVGDWPTLAGDAARSSSSELDTAIQGMVDWTFVTNAPILAAPAVVGDRVFLPKGNGGMVALDVETGETIWNFPVTGPIDSTPAVTADTVFVGLRDWRVLALDSDTGKLRWETKVGNPILGGPLVHDGVVYVGAGDGILYALDAFTGQVLWTFDGQGWILGSVSVSGDRLAIVNSWGLVNILDSQTGKKRLSFVIGEPVNGTPVFNENQLLIGTNVGHLVVIDSDKLEYSFERAFRFARLHFFLWGWEERPPVQKGLLWGIRLGKRQGVTTPAVVQNIAYMGIRNGELLALDLQSRELLWQYDIGSTVSTNPVATKSEVYLGDTNGTLHAIDRFTGNGLWTMDLGDRISSDAVIAQSRLFVSTSDGTLHVIR